MSSASATMTNENPSRHAAITSAGAFEYRTSGAANEMPTSATASASQGERAGAAGARGESESVLTAGQGNAHDHRTLVPICPRSPYLASQ